MGFAENTVKFRGKEVQAQERNKERYFGGCLKSMFSVCFQAKSECAPAKNGMIQQGHEFTFSKILDPPPFLGKFMFKKQC
jgi:hypothetical protein